MNIKILVFFSFFTFLLSCSGCATGGLERTSWEKLERVNYPSLGLSLNLPKQPISIFDKYIVKIYDSDSYQNTSGYKTIYFAFHPFKSGQPLTEPDYLLTFRIIKTNPGDEDIALYNRYFEENTSSLENHDRFTTNIEDWVGIDRYSTRKYFLFRKDIKCTDGSLISAGAKLVMAPHINKKEDKDKVTIRNLLNSIQCISSD